MPDLGDIHRSGYGRSVKVGRGQTYNIGTGKVTGRKEGCAGVFLLVLGGMSGLIYGVAQLAAVAWRWG